MTSKSRRPLAIYVAVFAGALAASGAVVWLAARLFPTPPAFAPTPAPPPASLFSPNALYTPTDRARLMGIGTAFAKKQTRHGRRFGLGSPPFAAGPRW